MVTMLEAQDLQNRLMTAIQDAEDEGLKATARWHREVLGMLEDSMALARKDGADLVELTPDVADANEELAE